MFHTGCALSPGDPSPTTWSDSINILLFGEAGVGKSSVINLIAQTPIAKVSSDVNGCTMESTRYDIPFDGMHITIFDTIGLEEPEMEVEGYQKAIEKAFELITKLEAAGGIHLLLFCMRGGRITVTTQSNYRMFYELLCNKKVPIALVFTGLEREVNMEDWWKRNKTHIEHYGIKSHGHACITAVHDGTPEERFKYGESQKKIRGLIKSCALKKAAALPGSLPWYARAAKGMMSLLKKGPTPGRKKLMTVLTKRCHLVPDVAEKILDMMEKSDMEPNENETGQTGKRKGEGGPNLPSASPSQVEKEEQLDDVAAALPNMAEDVADHDVKSELISVEKRWHEAVVGKDDTTLKAIIGAAKDLSIAVGAEAGNPCTQDVILVRGFSANVDRAVKEIQQILEVSKNNVTDSDYAVKSEVDREYVGQVVGAQGVNIIRLRDQLGVRVDISDEVEEKCSALANRDFSPRQGEPADKVCFRGEFPPVRNAKAELEKTDTAWRDRVVLASPTAQHRKLISGSDQHLTNSQTHTGALVEFPGFQSYNHAGETDSLDEVKDINPTDIAEVTGARSACEATTGELKARIQKVPSPVESLVAEESAPLKHRHVISQQGTKLHSHGARVEQSAHLQKPAVLILPPRSIAFPAWIDDAENDSLELDWQASPVYYDAEERDSEWTLKMKDVASHWHAQNDIKAPIKQAEARTQIIGSKDSNVAGLRAETGAGITVNRDNSAIFPVAVKEVREPICKQVAIPERSGIQVQRYTHLQKPAVLTRPLLSVAFPARNDGGETESPESDWEASPVCYDAEDSHSERVLQAKDTASHWRTQSDTKASIEQAEGRTQIVGSNNSNIIGLGAESVGRDNTIARIDSNSAVKEAREAIRKEVVFPGRSSRR